MMPQTISCRPVVAKQIQPHAYLYTNQSRAKQKLKKKTDKSKKTSRPYQLPNDF